jgi:hypothetical protein
MVPLSARIQRGHLRLQNCTSNELGNLVVRDGGRRFDVLGHVLFRAARKQPAAERAVVLPCWATCLRSPRRRRTTTGGRLLRSHAPPPPVGRRRLGTAMFLLVDEARLRSHLALLCDRASRARRCGPPSCFSPPPPWRCVQL